MLRTDPSTAQFPIDPTRLDLAREFRRAPKGPHSPELRRVLHRMRWSAAGGRWCVVPVIPGKKWMLALLPTERGAPIRNFPELEFTSLDDAEWHVFRLRWQALTGQELPADLPPADEDATR